MTRGKCQRTLVEVSCAQCGLIREVRPKLVEGYAALVCASHKGMGSPDSLQVPEGYRVVTDLTTIAAFFRGYSLEPTTPETKLAVWRASCLVAAAADRPLPPRPEVKTPDRWNALQGALGEALRAATHPVLTLVSLPEDMAQYLCWEMEAYPTHKDSFVWDGAPVLESGRVANQGIDLWIASYQEGKEMPLRDAMDIFEQERLRQLQRSGPENTQKLIQSQRARWKVKQRH